MASVVRMISIQVAKGGKSYAHVAQDAKPDNAISKFMSEMDKIGPDDSIRLVEGDKVIARKTPKSVFLDAKWK